jgi:hypothetical protein
MTRVEVTTAVGFAREPLLKGKAQYDWLLVLTSLDQLIFIHTVNIFFTFDTKRTTLLRWSTVPSLLHQLAFPGLGNFCPKSFPTCLTSVDSFFKLNVTPYQSQIWYINQFQGLTVKAKALSCQLVPQILHEGTLDNLASYTCVNSLSSLDGATTLSIKTLSITTFSIKANFAALSINDT